MFIHREYTDDFAILAVYGCQEILYQFREMVVNEEENTCEDSKLGKRTGYYCDLCQERVAGVLSEKTTPCSGIGSYTSHLS